MVTYTITAQDGTTKKNWAVNVTPAQTSNGAADSNDGGQGGSSSTIKSQAMSADDQTDYILTVNVSGSGTVNQTLLSGTSSAASTYSYFASVQLTAVPAAGWTFTGWGGCLDGFSNPNSVTMSTDLTVTAAFKIVPGVTTVSSSTAANAVTLKGTLDNRAAPRHKRAPRLPSSGVWGPITAASLPCKLNLQPELSPPI